MVEPFPFTVIPKESCPPGNLDIPRCGQTCSRNAGTRWLLLTVKGRRTMSDVTWPDNGVPWIVIGYLRSLCRDAYHARWRAAIPRGSIWEPRRCEMGDCMCNKSTITTPPAGYLYLACSHLAKDQVGFNLHCLLRNHVRQRPHQAILISPLRRLPFSVLESAFRSV